MPRTFEADGDKWSVTSDGHDSHRAVRTVVFHCVSNGQRPYRVVEVPEPMLGDRGIDTLDEAELSDLFGRTHTMDFSHDSALDAERRGEDVRHRG